MICVDKVTSPIKTRPGNFLDNVKLIQTLKDLFLGLLNETIQTFQLNQNNIQTLNVFYLSNAGSTFQYIILANYICCGTGNIPRRLVGLTRLHTDDQLLSPFKVSSVQLCCTWCIPGHMAPWGLRLCPPCSSSNRIYLFKTINSKFGKNSQQGNQLTMLQSCIVQTCWPFHSFTCQALPTWPHFHRNY